MKRRFFYNTVSSLVYQIVAIVCGFILPKLYLHAYGSEINGLVSSITQFLGLITFCEMGVGSVIQSSLYKPLAEKDNKKLSAVLASGTKFFSKIGCILGIYIVILVFLFPYAIDNKFSWLFTATLIFAIGIGAFAQYFFGVIDNILLAADQRGYIQYNSQTVVIISNAIISVIIIKLNGSIQIVKLVSSFIYIARPLYLRYYINKNYSIDRKIVYEGEPIKQKWNGLAQHVASVVLGDTDTIVLTFFSSLSNVSIYSVYYLVVNGVKTLILSLCYGVQPILGELYAKNDKKTLKIVFGLYEYVLHTGVVFVFSCTSILIVPFISVYTAGIKDAIYSQPIFGYLLTFAYAILCLRTPYSNMIFAAGRYKETQGCFIKAALINLVISVICVSRYGLIGVAVGTFLAMLYQTVWMAVYNIREFFESDYIQFVKQITIDIIEVVAVVFCCRYISLGELSYLSWIVMSTKVVVCALGIITIVNIIFFKRNFIELLTIIGKRIKKQKR